MDFTVKMTPGELRAVYTRSLQNSERRLINLLVMEGYDPDTFDETTFEPRDGATPGVPRQGEVEIALVLDAINKIKNKIEKL
jgi:hypothetical protein